MTDTRSPELLASVEHPPWCDRTRCDVFTYPGRPEATEVFHTANLLPGRPGRRGLVELVQSVSIAADGQVLDTNTAVYLDEIKDGRLEHHEIAQVAAALARAAALIGYEPAPAPEGPIGG